MTEHKISGTHTGATVLPDGRIEIAPLHRESYSSLRDRENALNMLHRSVLRFINETAQSISTDNRRWWKRITDDLGLDIKLGWTCDGQYLIPKPAEENAEEDDHE